MPINQPPISKDNTRAAWDFEVTQTINDLEERVRSLLQAIIDADDLEALKEQVQGL
jgi:hypothetical protein